MLKRVIFLAVLATGMALAGPISPASATENGDGHALAEQRGSWKCSKELQPEDGDPGGVSGRVHRYWSGGGAQLGVHFKALDEIVDYTNTTSVNGYIKLIRRLSNGVETVVWSTTASPDETSSKDLSLPEGQRVYLHVRVKDRGSCTSDMLTT
ncbi:hypothetical protein [Amycolatopsis sp. EV170708-02-1]|uniref:hypothetical protein n=1 Tax=Amycolatopsis sp. EV170708-02-1 TaxID=2919322 RepID=UPI001F0BDAB5|nr:hypothetical protein [Amycolatopsis sp. EV170708-02-1]UMP07258.1 hypothetical protein MJQ72_21690 [Amycolatopsis sp. EV170708-02-1]